MKEKHFRGEQPEGEKILQNLRAKQKFSMRNKIFINQNMYARKKFASREEKILGNRQDERETLSWKTA